MDEPFLPIPTAIPIEKRRTSKDVWDDLVKQIQRFETELDDKSVVGIQGIALNGSLLVDSVRYCSPDLLIFIGTTLDGANAQLIQHVSQLNFCLVGIPRHTPEVPRRRIGFLTSSD